MAINRHKAWLTVSMMMISWRGSSKRTKRWVNKKRLPFFVDDVLQIVERGGESRRPPLGSLPCRWQSIANLQEGLARQAGIHQEEHVGSHFNLDALSSRAEESGKPCQRKRLIPFQSLRLSFKI